jgi:hypothetical protein
MLEDLKLDLRGLLPGTASLPQTKNNGPEFRRVTDIGTDKSERRLNPGSGLLVDAEKAPTPWSTWSKTIRPIRIQEL